jgi:alpha-D-ribose 1-methylphosphonate 5-triphosphate synthase subunit PhnI
VDFQAELTLLRQLRSEWDEARAAKVAASPSEAAE